MARPISSVTDDQIQEAIKCLKREGKKVTISAVCTILHVRRNRVQPFVAAHRAKLKELKQSGLIVADLQAEISRLGGTLKDMQAEMAAMRRELRELRADSQRNSYELLETLHLEGTGLSLVQK